MGLFGKARGLFSTPQFTEKLAAIGGTLRDDDGGRSAYAYQALQERRRQEEQQAQQQQQAREFDWQDWVKREQWKRDNPEPRQAQPYRFEDNAGNVYEYDGNGTPKPIFIDPNDRTYVQDGQLVKVPNVVRQQQSRPAIGATIQLDGLGGGAPTPQAVPMSGAPRRVSARELNALVTRHGTLEVEQMIKSGQIVIGGN